MPRRFVLPLCVIALAGCDGGDTLIPELPPQTVAEVTVPADGADFSLNLSAVTTPDEPIRGAFNLWGRNVRYDDGDGVLLVDLRVSNQTEHSFPEPVTLTITDLLPAGVTLWNPPGGGSTYEFGFANDDAQWTPGESSEPLTVAFLVDPGVSVGFRASVGVGYGGASGQIGGLVFNDLDGDGEADPGEEGVAGVPLKIEHGEYEFIARAVTGADGRYLVPGLPAGAYTVTLLPQPLVAPTGDTVLHVLLVELDGGVAPFLEADFGVLFAPVNELTVFAEADATVRADIGSRMNDNHGADPFLAVGTSRDGSGANDRIRGLVRFALPPVDSTLVRASLDLTIAAFRDGSNQTYELVVNPIVPSGDRTPWPEGNGSEVTPLPDGVVWVDAADGVAWIGAGDGGDANNTTQPDFAPVAAAEAIVVQADHAAGDVISFDVTDLVRAWASGDLPNLGLVIRDVGAGSSFRQLWFGARDGLERGYTDPRVQPGPRLVLDYEMPRD